MTYFVEKIIICLNYTLILKFKIYLLNSFCLNKFMIEKKAKR